MLSTIVNCRVCCQFHEGGRLACKRNSQSAKEGSGGDFDHFAMSELFAMGLIEVQPHDRRLILSKAGRDVYLMLKSA